MTVWLQVTRARVKTQSSWGPLLRRRTIQRYNVVLQTYIDAQLSWACNAFSVEQHQRPTDSRFAQIRLLSNAFSPQKKRTLILRNLQFASQDSFKFVQSLMGLVAGLSFRREDIVLVGAEHLKFIWSVQIKSRFLAVGLQRTRFALNSSSVCPTVTYFLVSSVAQDMHYHLFEIGLKKLVEVIVS